MERAELEVMALTWDERNEAKLAVHGVKPDQIEDVLWNAPRFFVNLPGRTAEHVMIGPDWRGRFFFAPIVPPQRTGPGMSLLHIAWSGGAR